MCSYDSQNAHNESPHWQEMDVGVGGFNSGAWARENSAIDTRLLDYD